MSERILIADDDPDIVRFVEVNLRLEGYDVVTAADGEEAIAVARENRPALALLDVMMPRLDGYEVCQRLRSDPRHAEMSIIILTAKSLSVDKVVGLTAGADDYIIKPFDPMELVARVKSTLRRAKEMRSLSPLTGLPGNIQIEREIERRVAGGEAVAVLYADLDNFKAFNDRYGFLRGDQALTFVSSVLAEVVQGHARTFLGHIGGDDFIIVCLPEDAETISRAALERFEEGRVQLYDPEDAERGSIQVEDRRGNTVEYPLMTMSVGIATNARRSIIDYRELVVIATEMKSYAKTKPGSVYEIDRRTDADDHTE